MCGVVGAIDAHISRKRMRRLWTAADKAGGESWGVMFREDDQTYYQKGVGPLLPNAVYLIDQVRHSGAWCAHSRLATTGEVTRDNAHPFIVSGKTLVVGMHNGVITNWHRYAERGTRVDSEVIFQLIAHEDWPTLEKLRGWAACFWMDDQGNLTTWSSNKALFIRRDRPGWLLSSVPGTLPENNLQQQKEGHVIAWKGGQPLSVREVNLCPSYYNYGHEWIPGLQRWSESSTKASPKGDQRWPYRDPDDPKLADEDSDEYWEYLDKTYRGMIRRHDEETDISSP